MAEQQPKKKTDAARVIAQPGDQRGHAIRYVTNGFPVDINLTEDAYEGLLDIAQAEIIEKLKVSTAKARARRIAREKKEAEMLQQLEVEMAGAAKSRLDEKPEEGEPVG